MGNDADLKVSIERSLSPTAPEVRAKLLENPAFGRQFSDHMATARYSAERGWHDAKIEPRGGFNFDPASLVFHYAQEIFEGMKAYRQPDGSVALFRPDANARRFRNSANRLAMAPLPESLFLESVRELVRIDRDWIPAADGAALYLRPFMIATEVLVGMKPSAEYLYCAIASPVGSYFKAGSSAVTVWVSEDFTRAGPGGTGDAKCGGNYAASLAAQAEAARQGCDQVVFLDAVDRCWVEELGAMNIFFVFNDGSIQTPPLTGTILPGITRESLMVLAGDMGMTVREEPYAIDQWQADAQSGRLTEAFACGTAAVVTPIGTVKGRQHNFTVGDGDVGPVASRLKSALLDIQQGRAPDTHGWMERIG
ncbi:MULTISPECIES: branched-chain amino acid aminotransferase [Cupriavidus]|uniref:Branched-chain-amino-acid aminotransferase n=1 Tax=Cupriavidus basilensis TaxID=68895 RepID=A0A643G1Y1_9BURK|nr:MULTISPECIES: branched-chain amino acid aminotransferase [Cupriavidus]KUE87959.1 branched chain amino acid aminotransferase [Cupriavidus necator]NOV23727.1 branched-chain amino acid aminotransferase [Cupriavidus necator]QOT81782.1 branched-chain amino acid aminotransferase [Cupriavidus basilensis]BDB30366.1 branched-chain amino acid aminotransferase [Cupriavidus sp. P-10]